MNPIPMQHMQKENRQKPRVSAGFVAGAEGLEPSARGFGVDVGTHNGKRGWGQVEPSSRASSEKMVLVWCCEEIFQAKTGLKKQ